jgi:hypothetical protein
VLVGVLPEVALGVSPAIDLTLARVFDRAVSG